MGGITAHKPHGRVCNGFMNFLREKVVGVYQIIEKVYESLSNTILSFDRFMHFRANKTQIFSVFSLPEEKGGPGRRDLCSLGS